MSGHVLISCMHVFDQMEEVGPMLEEHGLTWDLAEISGQQLSEEELLAIIDRYDAIIAGDDEITGEVLRASKLKVVAKWGIGIDAIDTDAAEALGIPVLNTPGVFGDEIADYALGYLVMLHRGLHLIDRGTRRGEWPKLRGRSIAGRRLGVVGLGSSGRELVRRAVVLGMEVVGFDVAPPSPGFVKETGCELVDLDELFATSDVVSLHVPLTGETEHLVDASALRRMRPGAYLINTARGGLVDQEALLAALDEGRLAGAALDVFESEPLPADHPLTRRDDVILGSHNASNTQEAVERTTRLAVQNVIDALRSGG